MNNVFTIVLLLTLLAVSGCDQNPDIEPSGNVIKVGFVGSYGGADMAQGRDTLEGVLAGKDVRPLLGNGDEIVIIAEEEGKTVESTQAVIKKLVEEDQVAAILLGSATKRVLEIKDFLDALEVPVISLIATHPDVVTGTDFISQLCYDDTMQGQVAALFIRDELLIKRVAILIDPLDPYSSYLGQTFRTKFESTGGIVTGFHTAAQMSEHILAQLQQAGTLAIYMPLDTVGALALIDLLDEVDWAPKLMASDGLVAGILSLDTDKTGAIEDMYATDLFSHSGDFIQKDLFAIKVERAFKSLFGQETSTFAALGVEGYMVLQHAMNQCANAADRQCINNHIRATRNFEGIMAKISIDENGRATRPVFISTIKRGRQKSVVKVY